MFVLSLVFWLILYTLGTCLESIRVKQGRWPGRNASRSTTALAGSLLYAVIMILVGLPILVLDFNVSEANNGMQNAILAFSLAWIIVNTLWIIYEKFWKKDLIVQHLVVLVGMSWVLYTDRNGWEMTAAATVGEILPCLYIGLLAKRWKYGSEHFFFINDTAHVISFIITRFGIYSILAYLVVAADDAHVVLATSAIGLLLICYYWGVKLIRKYLDKWGHRL